MKWSSEPRPQGRLHLENEVCSGVLGPSSGRTRVVLALLVSLGPRTYKYAVRIGERVQSAEGWRIEAAWMALVWPQHLEHRCKPRVCPCTNSRWCLWVMDDSHLSVTTSLISASLELLLCVTRHKCSLRPAHSGPPGWSSPSRPKSVKAGALSAG